MRRWVQMFFVLPLLSVLPSLAAVRVVSPGGKVEAVVDVGADGVLVLAVQADGLPVLEPSPLGVVVGKTDLGRRASVGDPRLFDECLPAGRRLGENPWMLPCRTAKIPILVEGWEPREWILEVKASDGGVAFRYIFAFPGPVTLVREVTSFAFPASTRLWFRNDVESGRTLYGVSRPEALPPDTCACLPVTAELQEGGRLMAIAEIGEFGAWSPMVLVPSAGSRLQAHHPEARMGWEQPTPAASPWRVVLVGADLDHLRAGTAFLDALAPASDAKCFPTGAVAEWLKAGRCLQPAFAAPADGCRWDRQHRFVDQAAELCCQYLLVDSGWRDPSNGWGGSDGQPWANLRELTAYAAARGVGIWLACPYAADEISGAPERRQAFLARLAECGVKGIRIDGVPAFPLPSRPAAPALLAAAAERRLLVAFHDCHPPAGEAVSWPNELAREGALGLSRNGLGTLPPSHYCTEPFVRGLAGPIDFSPATLRPELLKGTTPAFQTATAVVFASPLLCWPDPAESYLRSPAREIFRSLPCLWNETRILPASRIGRTVVMARRAREEWWLAVLNGSSEMALSTDVALDFLDPRWEYAAVAIADAEAEPGSSPRLALCPNLLFRQGDGYRVQALPGGGALLVLRPQRPVAPPRRGLFGWGFLGL